MSRNFRRRRKSPFKGRSRYYPSLLHSYRRRNRDENRERRLREAYSVSQAVRVYLWWRGHPRILYFVNDAQYRRWQNNPNRYWRRNIEPYLRPYEPMQPPPEGPRPSRPRPMSPRSPSRVPSPAGGHTPSRAPSARGRGGFHFRFNPTNPRRGRFL